jgi:SAM-dependent methyltransferase
MEIKVEIDTSKIANELKERAQEANNEEDLKVSFAVIFDPILRSWGITPHYEHRNGVRGLFSGIRKDALYGTVILEFKNPKEKKLDKPSEFEKAKSQLIKYIEEEANYHSEYYGRYYGILTDGLKIAFFRYRKGGWDVTGPSEVNAQTILKLLEAIRGLRGKPLKAESILEDFGPQSKITVDSITCLYKSLTNPRSSRTQMLFEDWRRVFSQVCAYSKEKLKGLLKYYKIDGEENIDVEKLMFSIHTYYTLVMKLLVSEVVTLFADSLIGSYLKRLEETYLKNKEELLLEIKELEEGGFFSEVGIKNFLEADYFAWYIDEWNDEIAETIYKIVSKLLLYEPATIELSPETVKDLFKKLYQNLVPKEEVRRYLGEYYTPDWLAELLLDEVGYDGNPDFKLLDPACGSGTFLVLAIKRIKEYAEEHFYDKGELLKKIINNVRGIDLNPLAVLAAKANYIIALSDLLRYRPKEGIEIPVYLADSILVERRASLRGKYIKEIYLTTSIGEFWIPQEIIDKGVLPIILESIKFCIQNKYSKQDFINFILKQTQEYNLSEECLSSLGDLYSVFLSLEKEGKDKIWLGILRNSFAPLLIGKFDYVVGNPPWINWENLPELYREKTKDLWEYYGLLKTTKGLGLGKVKRDISMLFVARCLDRFTKDGGKLAFLIPFTVYKTQAGAGFRKFLYEGFWRGEKENSPCKVLKIHDLVTLYPFEGAVNRTSMIIIEKYGKTSFPIPCVMWYNPESGGIDQEMELEEVKKITKQFEMIFIPIEKAKPESPWMQMTEKAYEGIKKVIGNSPWYKAYEGVNTALNQVYWIEIVSELPDGLLITNPPLSGQKKIVKTVKQVVEKELIYPLVRGRNVKRWYISGDIRWMIIPHDPKTGNPIEEDKMKINFPKSYSYFLNFKKELENRSIHKLWSKDKPFYSVYDIGGYTFYPYKVVWKEISQEKGKARLEVAVATKKENLPLIPDHKLMLIPLKNEEEAYYLSAILNSSLINFIVASYAEPLEIETHISQHIKLPKFNKNDSNHLKLSELSKKAHELARKIYEENREDLKDELKKIEDEIDKTVAQLYGITDEELEEIKKCLALLKEGEIPEEVEGDTEINLPKKNEIEILIEPLLIDENVPKELKLKIVNNLDEKLEDFNIKVKLGGEILLEEKTKKIEIGEEKVLKFKVPVLKEGMYELEVEYNFEENGIERVVVEKKKLFVKSSKAAQKLERFLDVRNEIDGGDSG